MSHLLVYLRSGHLLQVLQVGVKQVAAGQRNPQNRLDDVADGAVVGQADLLRRVHEVPATGKTEEQTDAWSVLMLLIQHFYMFYSLFYFEKQTNIFLKCDY